MRLSIPSIHLDAAVQPVGLTADGSLAVLRSTADVGWYKQGAYPGQKGSAVFDGHVDSDSGTPGVFGALTQLSAGSKLYVQDGAHSTTFVVFDKKYYAASDQPAAVFDKNDAAYLNLITCAGKWDAAKKVFTERLVVFARAAP